MKKLLLAAVIILGSCNANNDKSVDKTENPTEKSVLEKKIETYVLSTTNNPKLYKPLETTDKVLITDTIIIKNDYSNKQYLIGGKKIDFNAPKDNEPNIADIKDKFYSLVHKYEHQDNSGAIIITTIVLHIDDSGNVVYSSIVR